MGQLGKLVAANRSSVGSNPTTSANPVTFVQQHDKRYQ